MAKFESACKARTNVIIEPNRFLRSKQQIDETVDEFVSRLRRLASTWEYNALEEEIIRD